MEMLLCIILFVLTFNYLLVNIIYKLNVDYLIFSKLKKNAYTNIDCYDNKYWFHIVKKINTINIYFFQNNKYSIIPCTVEVLSTDSKIECSSSSYYNNINHPCNDLIKSLVKFI